NHVQPLDDHALFLAVDVQDRALTALVLARQQDDLVALRDIRPHHSPSGAREMIFMWFLARSWRGTGPKIRVPIGSLCLFTITAAFLSKRMTLPSFRLVLLLVRP